MVINLSGISRERVLNDKLMEECHVRVTHLGDDETTMSTTYPIHSATTTSAISLAIIVKNKRQRWPTHNRASDPNYQVSDGPTPFKMIPQLPLQQTQQTGAMYSVGPGLDLVGIYH